MVWPKTELSLKIAQLLQINIFMEQNIHVILQ